MDTLPPAPPTGPGTWVRNLDGSHTFFHDAPQLTRSPEPWTPHKATPGEIMIIIAIVVFAVFSLLGWLVSGV